VRVGESTEIGAMPCSRTRRHRRPLPDRARRHHRRRAAGLKYREASPSRPDRDETVIREYVTIHRATHEGRDTRVGGHCLLMASSHVAHDCVIGDHVIIINYAG